MKTLRRIVTNDFLMIILWNLIIILLYTSGKVNFATVTAIYWVNTTISSATFIGYYIYRMASPVFAKKLNDLQQAILAYNDMPDTQENLIDRAHSIKRWKDFRDYYVMHPNQVGSATGMLALINIMILVSIIEIVGSTANWLYVAVCAVGYITSIIYSIVKGGLINSWNTMPNIKVCFLSIIRIFPLITLQFVLLSLMGNALLSFLIAKMGLDIALYFLYQNPFKENDITKNNINETI